MDRLSEADQRLVFWGIGRHVGIAVSQDSFGRLVHPADTSRTDFHSGGSDVTALLVRDEGRTVSLAGTGRIVDEVVLRRPTWPCGCSTASPTTGWASRCRGEALPLDAPGVSHDGRLSLRYDRRAIESAQRFRGAALCAGRCRAPRPGRRDSSLPGAWRRDLALRAGDLLLINNYEVLHRHGGSTGTVALEPLRLWITLRHGRALPAAFTWPTPAYGETGGRGGVAPRDVVDPTHCRTAQAGHPQLRSPAAAEPSGRQRPSHPYPKPHPKHRGAMPHTPRRTGEEHMAKGIRFYEAGGPEVMQWESIEVGAPGPGEVRVRHLAVGLNFADTYFRSGLYPAALPAGMGVEGAGVVEAVGAGVTDFAEGDRVTYTGSPLGAYSTERVMSADHLIKLPDTIAFDTAAAMTMRGLTTSYLLRRIAPGLKAGDTVLLHAAAGGVGLLFTQWARLLGIKVIGSVSTRREGGRRQGARVRAHHRLHPRGRRDAGPGDHRRGRRAGRLRQHRPRRPTRARSTRSRVVASSSASARPRARSPRSTPWSSR